jgi:hypothetical protein
MMRESRCCQEWELCYKREATMLPTTSGRAMTGTGKRRLHEVLQCWPPHAAKAKPRCCQRQDGVLPAALASTRERRLHGVLQRWPLQATRAKPRCCQRLAGVLQWGQQAPMASCCKGGHHVLRAACASATNELRRCSSVHWHYILESSF